jgi:hypothetical protein
MIHAFIVHCTIEPKMVQCSTEIKGFVATQHSLQITMKYLTLR